ncbi:MAG TPA: heparinase II/III family protein [Dinghuibacter sp.]|uniref:heparinase II/III domain-containing protein n=1 Tax=Dinghuibacter sp. TaxID=2024697 RepID=UPI002C0C9B11|nr:heparinase II/III family protein [Dinghuibacter sp.]HTJ14020.1 heparinase II/III family protein [Dinghuibacter sp.]
MRIVLLSAALCAQLTIAAPAPAPAPRPAPAAPRNYLSSALRSSGLRLSVDQVTAWREARKQRLLADVQALPDSVKAALVTRADEATKFTWPALPVSLYHEFKTTGNRTRWEAKMFERRAALTALVAGELVTKDPKYLPAIADGLWATLEESTWVLPAHVGAQKIGTDLPDPAEAIVDLFDGETAAAVATTQWLLSEELDRFSKVIARRVRYELARRVFDPYLARDNFGWMGFTGGVPNNWNPWINSNVLTSVLLTGIQADTLNLVLDKVLRSTDNFINGYGDDGGCDEGPAYWSEAGGKLIHILGLATSVTQGRLDWSDIPLLHKIGAYIYKMHIAGPWYVNFADATARVTPDAPSVLAFGQYFHDDTLQRFAAYIFAGKKGSLQPASVPELASAVESYAALSTTPPLSPEPPLEWLPDVQVMIARAPAGPGAQGDLVFAAQGGNNGESHNHNDVGNFILFKGGLPAIVDAGVGTYTAKTFSKERYTLWNMQSQWHNCPLINGVQQMDGSRYKATDVTQIAADATRKPTTLKMDIAAAYPPAAAVTTWYRTFDFGPKGLELKDEYDLKARKDTTALHFMTPCTIEHTAKGQLLLKYNGAPLLKIEYDESQLAWSTTPRAMDDARLHDSWGDSLTRLDLVYKDKALRGKTTVRFSTP